jgi:glycerol uptake facilitator-like aquaporin
MNERLRAYGAELIGTAWMVAIGTGSVALGASNLVISLAFGVAVTTAILALRSTSGAHINPAVSAAFVVTGHLPSRLLPGYVLAQACGAILGSGLVYAVLGPAQLAPTVVASSVPLFTAVAIEVGITAALMASILGVVMWRDESTATVAVAVGATVAVLAFMCGPLTGASMNPARTFGPNLLSGSSGLVMYAISTTAGALLVGLMTRWRAGSAT